MRNLITDVFASLESQLGMTLVSSVLITRLGRRILFLSSQLICAISITALGAYFYIQQTDEETAKSIGWLPLASLMIYIGSFAFGSGPIPWVMTGEIVPRKVKSNRKDSSIAMRCRRRCCSF